MENDLKPCPFCEGTQFVRNDFEDIGIITCRCGAGMKAKTIPEHFELVSGDIYRKIPEKKGFDIASMKWNMRVNDG